MNFGKHYGRILWHLIIFVCLIHSISYAEDPPETSPPIVPFLAMHAQWIFSGSVANENGETYEYFFQAKRHDHTVQATVSLIDAQTKAVIFMQKGEMTLTDPNVDQWKMDDIFLRYNPINSSWVLGLKKPDQTGFNFKVDMLSNQDHQVRNVHPGVKLSILQTGQVNGHIQIKENSTAQFVSGKQAWFREILMEETATALPEVQGLLCHFEDGSRLYSMKVVDAQTMHGSFSGLFASEGQALSVSQFIFVDHLESGPWRVQIAVPKLQFELNDLLENQGIVLGFVNNKEKPGFCVISSDGLS